MPETAEMHRKFRALHRYFGIAAAILIAMLTTTGILLNHTDQLELDQKLLTNRLILDWYGVKPAAITSYSASHYWLSFDSKNVYLNKKSIHQCQKLIGAVMNNDYLVAACSNQLLILTTSGDLIEIIDKSLGLITPVTQIGEHEGQLFINTPTGTYHVDINQLSFNKLTQAPADYSKPSQPPETILQSIHQQSRAHSIHYERVLLDIHSGRIFGIYGVLLVDVGALLLLFMAFSGLWVWLHRYR